MRPASRTLYDLRLELRSSVCLEGRVAALEKALLAALQELEAQDEDDTNDD